MTDPDTAPDPAPSTELRPLFPTGILVADVPGIDNPALAAEVRALRADDPGRHALLTGAGFSSYAGARNLHRRPAFAPLMDSIGKRLAAYAAALGVDGTRTRMLINSCWSNIEAPGSQVLLHRHPNSLVSGAYYVEAPAGCGRIVFETPLEPYRMVDFPHYAEATPFSVREHPVEPAPGRLVLFPSWLAHRTEPNRSTAERIVVSFNVAGQPA